MQEEALATIQSYRQAIVSNQTSLEQLATQYSDCSSAKRGGDLGPFGPGDMQPAFEKATFALKVCLKSWHASHTSLPCCPEVLGPRKQDSPFGLH